MAVALRRWPKSIIYVLFVQYRVFAAIRGSALRAGLYVTSAHALPITARLRADTERFTSKP